MSIAPLLIVVMFGLVADSQSIPAKRVQAEAVPPGPMEAVLEKAGDNRAELQKVLDHYKALGDKKKLAAAEFLITHMGHHGFAEAGFYAEDGKLLEFDSLEYDTYKQARDALDTLKAKHGKIKVKRKKWVADVEVITAEYLINNIDEAFDAWRTNPWSRDVTFDTFCQYILPYRGSNEPIGNWRKRCRQHLADHIKTLEEPVDVQSLSKLNHKLVRHWAKFAEKCYLHPTDQSFEEMIASKVGRCEDLSNMQIYMSRANGIPIASDYTPAWARANNNHAWTVALDKNGKAFPRKNPMRGAAKVYRKMYAQQKSLPIFNKKEGETIPRWMGGKSYIDVTREYCKVHDVTVELTHPIPEESTYAYLCVFNSGRWAAIAVGKIDAEANTASFPDVGGNIAYYPAYCVDKKFIPAAPIHLFDHDGTVQILDALITDEKRIATTIKQTKDVDISPDTGKPIPAIKIEPGNTYELFYWNDEWVSLGEKESGDDAMSYDNLPPGRFYRLKKNDGRDQERPFTLNADGKQALW